MCDASTCLAPADGPQNCLPAPIWSNLDNLQFEGEAVENMTQIILVPGDYHDYLFADELALEVPPDAKILGLTVQVRRAGDDGVADDSVRIIKNGQIGDAERAQAGVWNEDLVSVSYGGPGDLWGEEWTPQDVNAPDFGVAFAAAYTRPAGNTRAYVDSVSVTVRYEVACE